MGPKTDTDPTSRKRPQGGSNPVPPHWESRVLPTELPRIPEEKEKEKEKVEEEKTEEEEEDVLMERKRRKRRGRMKLGKENRNGEEDTWTSHSCGFKDFRNCSRFRQRNSFGHHAK